MIRPILQDNRIICGHLCESVVNIFHIKYETASKYLKKVRKLHLFNFVQKYNAMLDPAEYDPFYKGYVQRFRGNENIVLALKSQMNQFDEMLKGLPEKKSNYTYAPGKWTIAEMLVHVVDTERVFSYRAFCISRGEKANLNKMNQDEYANNSNSKIRSIASISSEFYYVRKATIALLQSFNEDQWNMMGTASGTAISVRALGHILYGHCDHHIHILKSRYLSS